MASGRAFGIRAARSGAGGAGRKLTQFRLARFPRPHAPSPRPAPWAILFRPAGWGSVLAYLLRTDSRVFLRNPQSRHFRSRTLASGVLTRNGDLSSLGGPLAGERACLGRATARLMTPEGVIAGRKARPHGGGAFACQARARPRPVPWIRCQTSAHRVVLHIAHDTVQFHFIPHAMVEGFILPEGLSRSAQDQVSLSRSGAFQPARDHRQGSLRPQQ